jgi:PadR family transcriptional regulator, regulatory protein PadR
VQQGSLMPMNLRTLDVPGPLHGYSIALHSEQNGLDLLAVNQGPLYPLLLRLKQKGTVGARSGALQRPTAARVSATSRVGDANSLRQKRAAGNNRSRSWRASRT